ncbi:hypothetical protein SPRG_06529 [Saprolegnia parasitica CBS 223.65]|uniref:Uncharacterized protein n=1 Tax=Saprolegnia parasitica (strain CBS 223.65) TaxID=695850 RepID=A0A067CHQ0_SAPPC|nr:hypothetical protein SPRG_06529 [Saprolegnia parasitica CBS 223.65]KDO28675.1 hypothetical protein SPRG_06529 [Saprolegnia parasitica CBS 223.65]|eukprot:XP_012200734.1 hypothetical protein SPRG_06529 [Saprolegnia parasitica CBS 223.65]
MTEEWGDWPIDDENSQLMDLHPFWAQERQHQRCQAAYRQVIDAAFCTSGRCPRPDLRIANALLPQLLTPTDVAGLVQEYPAGCVPRSLCALDAAWSSRLHTLVQTFLGRGGLCALQLRCVWLGGATLLPATGFATVYVLLTPERDVWELRYNTVHTTLEMASTRTDVVPWLSMYGHERPIFADDAARVLLVFDVTACGTIPSLPATLRAAIKKFKPGVTLDDPTSLSRTDRDVFAALTKATGLEILLARFAPSTDRTQLVVKAVVPLPTSNRHWFGARPESNLQTVHALIYPRSMALRLLGFETTMNLLCRGKPFLNPLLSCCSGIDDVLSKTMMALFAPDAAHDSRGNVAARQVHFCDVLRTQAAALGFNGLCKHKPFNTEVASAVAAVVAQYGWSPLEPAILAMVRRTGSLHRACFLPTLELLLALYGVTHSSAPVLQPARFDNPIEAVMQGLWSLRGDSSELLDHVQVLTAVLRLEAFFARPSVAPRVAGCLAALVPAKVEQHIWTFVRRPTTLLLVVQTSRIYSSVDVLAPALAPLEEHPPMTRQLLQAAIDALETDATTPIVENLVTFLKLLAQYALLPTLLTQTWHHLGLGAIPAICVVATTTATADTALLSKAMHAIYVDSLSGRCDALQHHYEVKGASSKRRRDDGDMPQHLLLDVASFFSAHDPGALGTFTQWLATADGRTLELLAAVTAALNELGHCDAAALLASAALELCDCGSCGGPSCASASMLERAKRRRKHQRTPRATSLEAYR